MRRLAWIGGLVVLVAASVLGQSLATGPVRLDTGLVAGAVGVAAPTVRSYKGIPFAAPPTGENRWKAPQPAASWDGTRQATAFGNRCLAGGGFGGGRGRGAAPGGRGGAGRGGAQAQTALPVPPPASEDCLYVNVWTPARVASDRRPVMVWIYGGGFTGGSGSEQRYDGERLAAKGPVVVTFNYRLGQFGFFAHPELTKESEKNASGNYGMMDAIAALEWVKRNIGSFGGDPNNVTIFGESAGGIMVSALVGSPQAKGLFHRAISQSGAWMGVRMARMTTRDAAEQAGLKAMADMGVASLSELRGKSTEEVASGLRTEAGLIIDGHLIPEDLSLTFEAGRQHDVDLLSGSNADEGTFFPPAGPMTVDAFRRQAEQRFGELSAAFLELYSTSSDAQANASYLASYSDETQWNMRQSVVAQAKKNKGAYVYYFTRVPRGTDGKPSPRGATHTAEIQYVFNNPTGLNWDDVDRKLADTMSSYWVNFATRGDPNGPGLPAWPSFKSMTAGRAIVLGDTVQVEAAAPALKLLFYDAAHARLKEGMEPAAEAPAEGGGRGGPGRGGRGGRGQTP